MNMTRLQRAARHGVEQLRGIAEETSGDLSRTKKERDDLALATSMLKAAPAIYIALIRMLARIEAGKPLDQYSLRMTERALELGLDPEWASLYDDKITLERKPKQ